MDTTQAVENPSKEDIVYELAGSWKDDRSVEEMIDDIQSSRTTNMRVLESLDEEETVIPVPINNKWEIFMRGVNGFSDDFMADGRSQ